MTDHPPPSRRSTVRRLPERGAYDRDTIDAVLDEGLLCHVGIVQDGHPVVIPMTYARDGDRLILHGSTASRTMEALSRVDEVCVTVTLLDALVLARSAFHHSMNYRSVTLFATAQPITDESAKRAALDVLVDHLIPGRRADARAPNEQELAATAVVELPISEASAKVRTGPPGDDEEDYDLPCWAGLIPLALTPGETVPDPRMLPPLPVPDYVRHYSRGRPS